MFAKFFPQLKFICIFFHSLSARAKRYLFLAVLIGVFTAGAENFFALRLAGFLKDVGLFGGAPEAGVTRIGIAILVFAALMRAIGGAANIFWSQYSATVYQNEMKYSLLSLFLNRVDSIKKSEVIAGYTDLAQRSSIYYGSLAMLIINATMVFVFLVMCMWHSLGGTILIFFSGVLVFPVSLRIGKQMSDLGEKITSHLKRTSEHLINVVNNKTFIVASEKADHELQRLQFEFSGINRQYRAFSGLYGSRSSIPQFMAVVIFVIFLAFFFTDKVSVVALISFFYLSTRLIGAISQVLGNFGELNMTQSAVGELSKTIQKLHSAKELNFSGGEVKGVQQVELVNIRKDFGDVPVLRNISLVLNKGDVCHISGPSGAGKSTLIKIIMGLVEPDEGQVLIDGSDVSRVPGSALKYLSYCPPEAYWLESSFKENLIYSARSNVETESVLAALNRYHLSSFVSLLDNPETVQGERFSSGQMQRLSVIRSVLRKSPIRIFDEATANLDEANIEVFKDEVNKSRSEHITLIISHTSHFADISNKSIRL